MTIVITYGTYDLLHQDYINHLLPINDTPMLYYPITALIPTGETRISNIEILHKNQSPDRSGRYPNHRI